MFELITMEDDIKVAPDLFGEEVVTSLTKELNRKLANKGWL